MYLICVLCLNKFFKLWAKLDLGMIRVCVLRRKSATFRRTSIPAGNRAIKARDSKTTRKQPHNFNRIIIQRVTKANDDQWYPRVHHHVIFYYIAIGSVAFIHGFRTSSKDNSDKSKSYRRNTRMKIRILHTSLKSHNVYKLSSLRYKSNVLAINNYCPADLTTSS